jgi:hypothetical protein
MSAVEVLAAGGQFYWAGSTPPSGEVRIVSTAADEMVAFSGGVPIVALARAYRRGGRGPWRIERDGVVRLRKHRRSARARLYKLATADMPPEGVTA